MEFGVHLPVLGIGELPVPVERILDYAEYVEQLGFQALAIHDHFVHNRPWLDGPTMLAAALTRAPSLPLITAVWLPVLRGPVVMARTLIALDLLSGGRLVAGVGAGSSEADFVGLGVPFAERWPRFDESVHALRALLTRSKEPFRGRFYSTEGIDLHPASPQPGGTPLWIGSWGSDAGLRRAARLGDGWLASAYNTTPPTFATAWQRMQELVRTEGKDPAQFPNGLATMALTITDDKATADRVLGLVAGVLNRSPDYLRGNILVGPPDECAALLHAYREAGVQRLMLMPVIDGFRQLELFRERVLPLLDNAPSPSGRGLG